MLNIAFLVGLDGAVGHGGVAGVDGLVLAIMMTAGSSWSILCMRLDSLLASVRMLIIVVDNSLQVAKLSIIVRII